MWAFGAFSLWDGMLLVALVVFIYYMWYRRNAASLNRRVTALELPPLKRQDMTLAQLRQFDGRMPDGRILIAVDGKIFDVTRAKHLYGRDGPYGLFAGRDASRGLALFSIDESSVKEEYDDLSDLKRSEIEGMKEWSAQFQEKYPLIGRLLKPGEEPDVYTESDSDEESTGKRISGSSSPRSRPHVLTDHRKES